MQIMAAAIGVRLSRNLKCTRTCGSSIYMPFTSLRNSESQRMLFIGPCLVIYIFHLPPGGITFSQFLHDVVSSLPALLLHSNASVDSLNSKELRFVFAPIGI